MFDLSVQSQVMWPKKISVQFGFGKPVVMFIYINNFGVQNNNLEYFQTNVSMSEFPLFLRFT